MSLPVPQQKSAANESELIARERPECSREPTIANSRCAPTGVGQSFRPFQALETPNLGEPQTRTGVRYLVPGLK